MEFGSKCREYSHKKINWKMAFAKWMLFCFGLNLLSPWRQIIQSSIAMLHNHLRIECRTTDKWGQGWGPLSQFCCVPYFPIFFVFVFSESSNNCLFATCHVYTWQVSHQLNCWHSWHISNKNAIQRILYKMRTNENTFRTTLWTSSIEVTPTTDQAINTIVGLLCG